MIDAIEKNLQRGVSLLITISNEQYSDASVAPYFSSIGCNIRHVLDAFNSIFNGLESGIIDFTDRNRNSICEETTKEGIHYFNIIISKLQTLDTSNFNTIVIVKDDLGSGKTIINYTLESVLAYAHSHAIHHFASIGYIIHQLGIELSDSDFGYNPTTPKNRIEVS